MSLTSQTETIQYSLRNLIGCEYDDFWYSKCRYRVVKGSRGSKKSYTTAYWIILNMMKHPMANTLVIRKVADTLRDSVFAMLEKVIYHLHLERYWKMNKSPLEMTFLPTGQKILFRGLDDAQKLSSIQVTHGVLCWAWIEEAYQLTTEREFDLVDQSIRGKMPKDSGLWKSLILTFNPWNKAHWLRTRFFENEDGTPIEDPDIFTQTTTYLCNEWLDDADRQFFERMRVRNPRLYEVAGLGHWGNPEGLIYENWEEVEFDYHEIAERPGIQAVFGLDFGYTVDPSALVCSLVDQRNYQIWVFDELYETGLTNKNLARRIIEKGYGKETIICDSASPKDIAELGEFGLPNCRPSYKFPGSIVNGISRLQDYTIYINPRCVNFLTEIQMYAWFVNKDGITENKPQPGSMDHAMDAWRYSIEGLDMGTGGFLTDTMDAIEMRYANPVEGVDYPSRMEIEEHPGDKIIVKLPVNKAGMGRNYKDEDEEEDDSGGWCFGT